MSMKRSLLLGRRLSGLCLGKQAAPAPAPALQARKVGGTRFMSETPLCRIVGAEPCGDGSVGRLVINDFSPSSPGFTVLEKTVPMELFQEGGTIGASHGWVATLKDGVVTLQDDLNPAASASQPKRISLPPLAPMPHCQTQLVTNIALSSSSPDLDPDCILAVKFLGPQLSLCRPALKDKSQWVHIRIQDPSFSSSQVMFSKTDNAFSMLSSSGMLKASWDLEKHMHKPKLQKLYFGVLPELVNSKWAMLDECCITDHLVESRSTGDMFIVKRFRWRSHKRERMEEKRVMVFELAKDGFAQYAKDIGDLCIFLSKAEPFCLQASLYNDDCEESSVCFVDNNEAGMLDTINQLKVSVFSDYQAPYFIPPQSYLDAN